MSARVGGFDSKRAVLAMVRRVTAAMVAGALTGLVIGGVGGRIAMLVLRLTSDARLHGLETDDGFTIGIVSTATMFLLMLTMLAGVIGGLVYLGVRSWLPERSRPWLFATLTAVVGGALVIRPGGIDFTRLEPLSLAVAMFVALPALYGAATSLLAERFLLEGSAFLRSRASLGTLVLLLPIALLGLPGLAILAAVAGSLLLAGSGVRVTARTSTPVMWLGRVGMTAVGIAASVELARDITAVL